MDDIVRMVVVIALVSEIAERYDPQYQMIQVFKGIGNIIAASMFANTMTYQMQLLTLNKVYEKAKRCEDLARELYEYVTS